MSSHDYEIQLKAKKTAIELFKAYKNARIKKLLYNLEHHCHCIYEYYTVKW